MTNDKYRIGSVDLSNIRNRNEVRVIAAIRETLIDMGREDVSEDVVQDIFAYAMNQLAPRYAQESTIVLREPVRKEQIQQVVAHSILHILQNPRPPE